MIHWNPMEIMEVQKGNQLFFLMSFSEYAVIASFQNSTSLRCQPAQSASFPCHTVSVIYKNN